PPGPPDRATAAAARPACGSRDAPPPCRPGGWRWSRRTATPSRIRGASASGPCCVRLSKKEGSRAALEPWRLGPGRCEGDFAERGGTVHGERQTLLGADRDPVVAEVIRVAVGHLNADTALAEHLATNRERAHQRRALVDRGRDDGALTPNVGAHRQTAVAVGAGERATAVVLVVGVAL